MSRTIITTAALVLAVTANAAQQPDYPAPENCIGQAALFIANNLRDPRHAEVNFIAGPEWFPKRESMINEGCWGVAFSVNATNAFGGYTGFHTIIVFVTQRGPIVGFDTTIMRHFP